jgi:DNA (cytosine-5)-methyltransferase 1
MTRPRLLDLFCGAGGCAVGYHRAGFDIVGVDNKPQPHYPFEFVQADAMTFPLDGFDVIHASPPCQAYVGLSRGDHPRLLEPMLDRLRDVPLWVLENVPTSPLNGVTYCGQAFGLGVRRHRVFASPVLLLSPGCACSGREGAIRAYYGKPGALAWRAPSNQIQKAGRRELWRGNLAQAPADMGIDWMDWDGLREAIPPAYTQHIGEQLIAHLRAVS